MIKREATHARNQERPQCQSEAKVRATKPSPPHLHYPNCSKHASIAPEVSSKCISSPLLLPSALLLSTSHQVVLDITSVSQIRMLAGFGQPYMRGHALTLPTSSALQEHIHASSSRPGTTFVEKRRLLVPGFTIFCGGVGTLLQKR